MLKDMRERDATKRYMMLARDGYRHDMAVSFSPDGLNWTEMLLRPVINPVPVDGTHYNVLWAPELEKYVGITRVRGVGVSELVMEPDGGKRRIRQVSRTTSSDFLDWSVSELVMQGLANHLQIYSMPVFCHAGVYLGLPVIYNTKTDRAVTTDCLNG